MFIRSVWNPDMMIGGRTYRERVAQQNLYPAAFPFDRCAPNSGPGSVAFVAIHGRAPAVTTLTDLWGQNIPRTLPTAGFTIGISSSSTADVLTSGTGAWSIEVDALLYPDYVPLTIPMTLNGQTKVSDTTYVGNIIRINDVRITGWGTGLANAGDIYVYDASDAVVAGVPQTPTKIFHKILAGENVARGAFYTVPAGCKMQTQQVRGGIEDAVATNRVALIEVVSIRLVNGKRIRTTFPISGQIAASAGSVVIIPDFPLVFDEKTDITIQSSASGAVVLAAYMDAVVFYKD